MKVKVNTSRIRNVAHECDDPKCDGYTSTPTHLRIYREDVGDDWPWHIDGADESGHYTEEVARFASFHEVLANATDFAEEINLVMNRP